jgi:hypothetical protein
MYKNLSINLCRIFARPLSVQAQYSRLCPTTNSFRYNGSLDTLTVCGPYYIAPGGSNRKHRPQQFFYCCYGRLPSDSPDIVDLFTGRYRATHIPSSDRLHSNGTTIRWEAESPYRRSHWAFRDFSFVRLVTQDVTHLQICFRRKVCPMIFSLVTHGAVTWFCYLKTSAYIRSG